LLAPWLNASRLGRHARTGGTATSRTQQHQSRTLTRTAAAWCINVTIFSTNTVATHHEPDGQSFSDLITFAHADTSSPFLGTTRRSRIIPRLLFDATALPFVTPAWYAHRCLFVAYLTCSFCTRVRIMCDMCHYAPRPNPRYYALLLTLTIDLFIFIGTSICVHFFSVPCPVALTYSPTATATATTASGSFAPRALNARVRGAWVRVSARVRPLRGEARN
jgi:hypothetical protein